MGVSEDWGVVEMMALCRIAGRRDVISRALRARTQGCVARPGRCSKLAVAPGNRHQGIRPGY